MISAYRRKKNISAATKFFMLGLNDPINIVNFSLRGRNYFNDLVRTLDKQTFEQEPTFFFIVEKINLEKQNRRPEYIAVFSWFLLAEKQIGRIFQNIGYCEQVKIQAMKVSNFFELLCQRSFIERGMFQMLGRTEIKTINNTWNPFKQSYLFKNVSYITNLDSAMQFIDREAKDISEVKSYRKVLTQEQKQLSFILFATVSDNTVHLTQNDSRQIRRISNELKQYQVKNDDMMIDEEDEDTFENVSYKKFENKQSYSHQEITMMLNLKDIRENSINQIRERLKGKERATKRWDPEERLR